MPEVAKVPSSYTGPRIVFPLKASDVSTLLKAFKQGKVSQFTVIYRFSRSMADPSDINSTHLWCATWWWIADGSVARKLHFAACVWSAVQLNYRVGHWTWLKHSVNPWHWFLPAMQRHQLCDACSWCEVTGAWLHQGEWTRKFNLDVRVFAWAWVKETSLVWAAVGHHREQIQIILQRSNCLCMLQLRYFTHLTRGTRYSSGCPSVLACSTTWLNILELLPCLTVIVEWGICTAQDYRLWWNAILLWIMIHNTS